MWRGALGAFALIVGAVAVGALALLSGAADPPVAGPLVLDRAVGEEVGAVSLPAGAQAFLRPYWLRPAALTAEVTAALDGSPGASFGLWLQPCDRSGRLVAALDGEGFVAVWEHPADGAPPWTWFLHARPRPEVNRLRVDVEARTLTVRINDEIVGDDALARVAPPEGGVCAVGLYAAAEAEGAASAREARTRFVRAQNARAQFVRLRVWQSEADAAGALLEH